VVAVDLTNRRVLSVPPREGTATELAVSGRNLAAIVFDRGVYGLRIYGIDSGEDHGALAGVRECQECQKY
jgi:hypothetical protein